MCQDWRRGCRKCAPTVDICKYYSVEIRWLKRVIDKPGPGDKRIKIRELNIPLRYEL